MGGGIVFLAYDAGGHDEYQEMLQSFFTPDTLYILVWNVALPDSESGTTVAKMEEQQASWASLIQTCAPGSTVLLVASHADEVSSTELVQERCQQMLEGIHRLLQEHREAQSAELKQILAISANDRDIHSRRRHLQRVLERPLQLSEDVIVVSARTLDGVATLRRRMLEVAFNKTAFPSFGANQPNTYMTILRELRRLHSDHSSVTWHEMQQSLSRRLDIDGESFKVALTHSETVQSMDMSTARLHATLDAAKQAQWPQLQDILCDGGLMPEWLVNSIPHPRDYGILHQLAYHGASDVFLSLIEQGVVFNTALLTTGGETATKIALARGHTGFAEMMTSMTNRESNSVATAMVGSLACQINGTGPFLEDIRVELSAVGVLKVRVAALDERTGNLTNPGTTVQLPKTAHRRRPFCLQVTSVSPPWQFVFDTGTAIEYQRWENALQRFGPPKNATSFQMYTFSVSLCDEQVHEFTLRHRIAKDINAEMVERGCKGLDFPDRWKDKLSVDVTRRGLELTQYLQRVFDREDALAVFASRMGFEPSELRAQRCRVSDKVRQDPDLVRRAILYLRVTGEVLYHEYENVSVIRDRVFLEPQRLVNVMKELVRHDLQAQLDVIDPIDVPDAEEIQRLGQTFVTEGKLQRSLLPWLWRHQPQVVRNPEEMDFLIDLLTQLGLLTRVPEADPPQWILPIRLPDRDRATADAQNTFGNFLKQMEAGSARRLWCSVMMWFL